MSRSELGRVIDRTCLDGSSGARGRLRVSVPAAWVQGGGEIEIAVPARVACARCDGGGCDGCGRSGAHRTPSDPAARTLRIRLPAEIDGGVTVRLVQPFGEHAPLDQLLVDLSAGGDASPGVSLLAARPPPRASIAQKSAPLVFAVITALAIAVGILASR